MRLAGLMIVGLFSFLCMASTAFSATLTLRVAGLNNNSGVVRLCVFSEKSSNAGAYPDCQAGSPIKSANVTISGGQASVVFKDIPDGAYAVSLFHDADGDGRISMKSVFGVKTAIPREGIGVSNNPTLYGKPSFKEARFKVAGPTSITVAMKYF